MISAKKTGDRITFVGHSTIRIEMGGSTLLTDPVLRDRLMHLRRHADSPSPAASRGVDAVLISHLHGDHLDLPSLRTVGRGTRLIVPRGAAAWLRRHGFERVEEVGAGDTTQVGGVEIAAVRADHQERRWAVAGPTADALGYEVRGSRRVYFAGDTDLHPEMEGMAGSIDVALLPVWGWGTRLGPGHLDPRRAAEAAALIRPRIAVPIHWGTFLPVGRGRSHAHLLRDPPREFAAQVAEVAPGVEVALLEPGESLALDP